MTQPFLAFRTETCQTVLVIPAELTPTVDVLDNKEFVIEDPDKLMRELRACLVVAALRKT